MPWYVTRQVLVLPTVSGHRLRCMILLVALAACGRTSLKGQRTAVDAADEPTAAGGNGPGDIANDTGGRPGGGGLSGATLTGGGGSVGMGGSMATGRPAGTSGTTFPSTATRAGGATATGGGLAGTAGTSSLPGTGGLGGVATGGASTGTGGSLATGGTVSTGGVAGTGGAVAFGGATSGGITGSGGSTEIGDTCGDGIVDPGEQCDLGADNEDLPAFWIEQSGQGFAVNPLMQSISAEEFYGYSSASAHTGLEALETSRMLLHLYPPALSLSLVFLHGVDRDSTELEQPASFVQMLFDGLPLTTIIGVVDDTWPNVELMMTSDTTATGYWFFENNSDGGVLSGLPFPGDWEISINPSFGYGISLWTWVRSDGSFVTLDMTQPMTIRANSFPSLCRRNCTEPRCGDGILDGGEVCDGGDGTGTGCSSTCQSFE